MDQAEFNRLPHDLEDWVSKLRAVRFKPLVLHSVPHDGIAKPDRYLALNYDGPQDEISVVGVHQDLECLDVECLKSNEQLSERLSPMILGYGARRRFDVVVSQDDHSWFDAKPSDTLPEFIKGTKYLGLAVHLGPHEDLSHWTDQRRPRETKGTLLGYLPSLTNIDICVTRWDWICARLGSQTPDLIKLNTMYGIEPFLDWLKERIPAHVHVNFVQPEAFENLGSVGPTNQRMKEILDPSVLNQLMQRARTLQRLESTRSTGESVRLQRQDSHQSNDRGRKAARSSRGGRYASGIRRSWREGTGRMQEFLKKISKPTKHKPYKARGLRIR